MGYAQGEHVSLWAQTRDFVSHYPDVLMAWVGFVMFIAVGVTSVQVARRKLQRQTWYFIHLYAYVAVALTFAHQLAVGTDFSSDRAGARLVDLPLPRRVRLHPLVARASSRGASIFATISACTPSNARRRASSRFRYAVAIST